MPKRIPHTDLEIITGEKITRDYLKMQKVMGKFYFNDFFSKFDSISGTGGRFLEIGPGPGYQTTLVYERFKPDQLIGLEYSADMIKIAEEYAKERGLTESISYIEGAVENTGLIRSLGKFDMIYSTFSLHHWTDPVTGIRNLYESLSENAIMFIYDFYRGGFMYYVRLKRGIWESIRASYRPEEIRSMLLESGINHYSVDSKGLYMNFIVKK